MKDKLLHSGKVPMNAELSPLKREKRGTEVLRYGTLNEAMKLWRNNLQFLHKTATHIFPYPFIHTCPLIVQERLDSTILKEQQVTRKLLSKPLPYQLLYQGCGCHLKLLQELPLYMPEIATLSDLLLLLLWYCDPLKCSIVVLKLALLVRLNQSISRHWVVL